MHFRFLYILSFFVVFNGLNSWSQSEKDFENHLRHSIHLLAYQNVNQWIQENELILNLDSDLPIFHIDSLSPPIHKATDWLQSYKNKATVYNRFFNTSNILMELGLALTDLQDVAILDCTHDIIFQNQNANTAVYNGFLLIKHQNQNFVITYKDVYYVENKFYNFDIESIAPYEETSLKNISKYLKNIDEENYYDFEPKQSFFEAKYKNKKINITLLVEMETSFSINWQSDSSIYSSLLLPLNIAKTTFLFSHPSLDFTILFQFKGEHWFIQTYTENGIINDRQKLQALNEIKK